MKSTPLVGRYSQPMTRPYFRRCTRLDLPLPAVPNTTTFPRVATRATLVGDTVEGAIGPHAFMGAAVCADDVELQPPCPRDVPDPPSVLATVTGLPSTATGARGSGLDGLRHASALAVRFDADSFATECTGVASGVGERKTAGSAGSEGRPGNAGSWPAQAQQRACESQMSRTR